MFNMWDRSFSLLASPHLQVVQRLLPEQLRGWRFALARQRRPSVQEISLTVTFGLQSMLQLVFENMKPLLLFDFSGLRLRVGPVQLIYLFGIIVLPKLADAIAFDPRPEGGMRSERLHDNLTPLFGQPAVLLHPSLAVVGLE